MKTEESSKYDTYYEIARDKYLEAWDRNKQVERKATGALGIAGIIVAFAINVSDGVALTWWWVIPGALFLGTLIFGVIALLPRTWKYDPDAEKFGAEISEMTADEAKLGAANSYAVATAHNNDVVTQKANYVIYEYVLLGLAVLTLVVTLALGY